MRLISGSQDAIAEATPIAHLKTAKTDTHSAHAHTRIMTTVPAQTAVRRASSRPRSRKRARAQSRLSRDLDGLDRAAAAGRPRACALLKLDPTQILGLQ